MKFSASVPRIGIFATVRNRCGLTTAVEPFDGPNGRLHLVSIDYKDDQLPRSEKLIWELEAAGRLLEPTALPNVASSDPMPVEDYDALLRAARWSAATPFLDPDGSGPLGRLPFASPLHGAVQVDDFQLVPLLKALRMPRVSLLIADDVGLGKTVEAGLILSELLLRRRVQRVLIITPASLRVQWRDEMWDKFSLSFDLVDRDETHALRRRLGMDANPWRSFSRVIASYHYLRQEDVLEQFLAACKTPDGSPHLPWDLLIVDECHNLMPSAFGADSDLCRMLRLLAPQFEHRLFLSATPHNGHTRCFTGLLEILDPVRFSQTDQLGEAERGRVEQVVIRRLKREVNARTNPPKFCTRLPPVALVLQLSPREIALSAAFDTFRRQIRTLIANERGSRRRTGTFAVEILGKRLLSCSVAFADSWRRCKQGLAQDDAAADSEVQSARRNLETETGDDRETQSRFATVTSVVGAWLKNIADSLEAEIAGIDAAVAALNLDFAGDPAEIDPIDDTRYARLEALIEEKLGSEGRWRNDERLVVFTEYKTTLDYLARRLTQRFGAERVLTLFGGMDDIERGDVKAHFNNLGHPVRVLVATDAAAEGLNLQRTARYLLHFDCPWNPSRIEQRNGRIDRHGQPRDVTIFHFASDQDQDISFLSHVIRKADEIREDLGSTNEIFDEAVHRRLVAGESAREVEADLDRRVRQALGRVKISADAAVDTVREGRDADSQIKALAAEIDLDPRSLRDTLESAMAVRGGRPQLECVDAMAGSWKLVNPGLPGWSEVIDDSMRRPQKGGAFGPVSRIAFDAVPFLDAVGGRMVFSPRPDILMAHLSHPMLQHAISTLTRRRFPGTGEEVSRWTVRRVPLPAEIDAQVLFSVEELAVNELRETFHHWVRTIIFPVKDGKLGAALPHTSALALRGATRVIDVGDEETARRIVEDIEHELKAFIGKHTARLTTELRLLLDETGKAARIDEETRYRSRQAEVSSLISENTLAKLEREIESLKRERAQGVLFDEAQRLDEIDRSIDNKRAEIERRTRHHTEVREQLDRERDRILKFRLPRRHAMSGPAQVFPISIEVRLPTGAQ